jgi:hypothetical protein
MSVATFLDALDSQSQQQQPAQVPQGPQVQPSPAPTGSNTPEPEEQAAGSNSALGVPSAQAPVPTPVPQSAMTPPNGPGGPSDTEEPEEPEAPPQRAITAATPVPRPAIQPAPSAPASRPAPTPFSSNGALKDDVMTKIWADPRVLYSQKVALSQQVAARQKLAIENGEAANKLAIAHNDRFVALMDPILNTYDPAQKEPAYQLAKAIAIREGLPGAQDLPDTYEKAGGDQGIIRQRLFHMTDSEIRAEAKDAPKMEQEALATAGQTIGGVKDAPGYQVWLGNQPWQIRRFLPQAWSDTTPDAVRTAAKTVEQQAKEPLEKAQITEAQMKADQATRANVGAQFNSIKDPVAFTRTFDKQPDTVKAQLTAAGITPEEFNRDPKGVAKQIQEFGLNANEARQAGHQETQDEATNRRLDIAERNSETQARRADATIAHMGFMNDRLAKLQSGQLTQAQLQKDVNAHDALRQKETDEWGNVQKYETTAASDPSVKTLPDPKNPGSTVPNTPAVRAEYKAMADTARAKAVQYHNSAYDLRAKLGGEFGERYPAPTPSKPVSATPAAATSTSATTPKPAAPKPTTGKLRSDIPDEISGGIAEGQTRPVNGPGGAIIKLKKINGKLYQQ